MKKQLDKLGVVPVKTTEGTKEIFTVGESPLEKFRKVLQQRVAKPRTPWLRIVVRQTERQSLGGISREEG
jgi:hypothetical protein